MPVNFDLERMKESLASEGVTVPRGLTREQLREWVSDLVPIPEELLERMSQIDALAKANRERDKGK